MSQGGCEQRIEVFVKTKKKNIWGWGVGGGSGGWVVGGGVGAGSGGRGGWGVRIDVTEK